MPKHRSLVDIGYFLVVAAFIAVTVFAQQREQQRVEWVVATQTMEPGHIIAPEHVRVVAGHPMDFRPDVMFTKEKLGSLHGVVVTQTIYAHEPVVVERLASADGRIGNRLSDLLIKPGNRLISWPTRELGPLASRLRGGDRVDLTVSLKDEGTGGAVTKTVLQLVPVITVAKDDIVFEVPAQTAEILDFARTAGHVDFALAGPLSSETPTTGVDRNKFRELYLGGSGVTRTPTPSPSGAPRR